MLKLLIVEDEQVIRNGLEKHVPWKELGIDQVFTAENAECGLRICDSNRPDIIVSDINMPGMNGVELCRALKEKLPLCEIVFISGYSDKEYLKAAIALGAVSYVEKPIDIAELSDAVKQAVERVKQHSRQNETVLHTLLSPASDEQLQAKLMGIQKQLKWDRSFRIFLFKQKEMLQSVEEFLELCRKVIDEAFGECADRLHLTADFVGDRCFALLLSTDCEDLLLNEDGGVQEFCESFIKQCSEQERWFVAVGQAVDAVQRVVCSYHSAQEVIKVLAYKGWNHYALTGESAKEYQGAVSLENEHAFRKALMDSNVAEGERLLAEWSANLVKQQVEMSFQVRNIYYILDTIIMQVEDLTPRMQQKCEDAGRRFLDDAQTIYEMQEYVAEHLKGFRQNHEEVNANVLIKKVIDYMNAHLSDKNISIKLLADEVYLTPTYLSNLFKKTTGSTIGQYLTDIRMNKAQELLMDTGLKLYQIAEMVGFEDANYFAKSFKKKTGMLPSEYRDSKVQ